MPSATWRLDEERNLIQVPGSHFGIVTLAAGAAALVAFWVLPLHATTVAGIVLLMESLVPL